VQNTDDRLTRFRVERIDETGDEELHGRHNFILILNHINRCYGLLWYDLPL
jgi:hypothetical protein